MAYAALSSLMNTLEQLSKPNQSLVCRSCTQHHVQSIHQNLSDLQLFLEDTTTKDIQTLKVIEKRIRNVVYRAEDRVDSTLRRVILADREDKRQKACTSFYEELLQVEEQVHFLNKEVMQIEFNKHGSRSAELATPSLSSQDKSTIVGMEDEFNTILDCLTAQTKELTVIPIFGMGGIGKTTLARKVYDDSRIRSRFDKHAWVTISEEYNERQMLLEIVSSITTGSNQEMSDDQLMETVYRGLKGRRFLIVIDDIWSTDAWDQVQRIFPNDDRSLILTGRQRSPNGRIRTCKIHDLLRQLCLREGHTENVVHIMNGNVPEVIYDQRRVILLPDLQEKQVYPIRHSSGIIRTFISMKYFSSDFSEGIFSIVSQLKLLKVLDVLSVEYDFSSVIPQLVHLRYVAARIKEALSLAN